MIREITVTDARKNFGAFFNEVKYRHDPILIKNAGKPVAALIDIEKIRIFKYQFDSLTQKPGKTYAGISIEEAEHEIKELMSGA